MDIDSSVEFVASDTDFECILLVNVRTSDISRRKIES